MQDEKIAKYIGEAVILLTADHLGIEVEMLAIAKEVWHTKRLPDAPLLGHYASAARNLWHRRRCLPKGSASGPTASDRCST